MILPHSEHTGVPTLETGDQCLTLNYVHRRKQIVKKTHCKNKQSSYREVGRGHSWILGKGGKKIANAKHVLQNILQMIALFPADRWPQKNKASSYVGR